MSRASRDPSPISDLFTSTNATLEQRLDFDSHMDPHVNHPFFQFRRHTGYSYGDPRGGSYPEPLSAIGEEENAESTDDARVVDESDGLGSDIDDEDDDDDNDDDNAHADNDDKNKHGMDMDFDDPDNLLDQEEFPSSGVDSEIEEVYKRQKRKRNPQSSQSTTKQKRPKQQRSNRPSAPAPSQPRPRKSKRNREPAFIQSPQFKRLNGLITNAWLNQDHENALKYALEAVQLYPEHFPLHATIAEILDEKGRPHDAIGALFTGVQASRNPDNWWYTIDRIQSIQGGDPKEKREKLAWCYSKLVSMNPKDLHARLGRAQVALDNGLFKRAKHDAELIFAQEPANTKAVFIFVAACMALDASDLAMTTFETYLDSALNARPANTAETDLAPLPSVTWDLISGYLDVLMEMELIEKSISQLSRLSRWMLGRPHELFWADFPDDREWDCDPNPRRRQVPAYRQNPYSEQSYGLGLPLEFRLRLGILRVTLAGEDSANLNFREGLRHLRFLLQYDLAEQEQHLDDYVDMYKEAGDCLREAGHHKEALAFYEPVLEHSTHLDSRFSFDIAICYQALDRPDMVRAAINRIKHGEQDPLTQIGLAKLYQARGNLDLMWRIISQLKKKDLHALLQKEGLPLQKPAIQSDMPSEIVDAIAPSFRRRFMPTVKHKRSSTKKAVERKESDKLRAIIVKELYGDLKRLEPDKTLGIESALQEWKRIAADLFLEFKGHTRFFQEKTKPYIGEAWGTREVRLDANDIINPQNKFEYEKPKYWRSVLLDDWVDLLAQYAITLAEQRKLDDCRDVLDTMSNTNVVYPEPERMHTVRTASLRSAIVLNHEEWLLEECRWFCKSSEYATDGFRLPSAISRALHLNPSAFRSGANQKFWLRQIRVMDYSLLTANDANPEQNAKFDVNADGGRAKWAGNGYNVDEFDPELYMLYGHLMIIGSTPTTALNYYLRAHAMRATKSTDSLDTWNGDATLHLCIALAYICLACKRQTSNRLLQMQHAFAFFDLYYQQRMRGSARQQQEAEFNKGMLYNSLALHHVALRAYDRCMALSAQVCREQEKSAAVVDLTPEAALAKRHILAVNGDVDSARKLTERYLVL